MENLHKGLYIEGHVEIVEAIVHLRIMSSYRLLCFDNGFVTLRL